MSKLAELANEEALPDEEEAAEEEEATPTPEPEPEPAEEPPPEPGGLNEGEAEREFKKLEKLAQTYLTKAVAIADKLGIPYQVCPLDAFPGLAIPRHANEVTSDIEAAVLGLIGKNPTPDLKIASDYARCEACDGWGEVLTGVQKEISRAATCNACGGKGFKTVFAPLPVSPPNGQAPYPGATQPYTPLPQGIPDAWQRPAGHPHWGLDPREIGV